MADYAALQEQNKLAALRAMAAGNPDPYGGSSGVISGAQEEALTRYAGEAAGRNAPQGSISQGEAMIRGPGDAALAGLGQSSSAYANQLAALHAEAANAAAPPGSFSSGSSSTKKGPGYNQYGGYQTSAEYENAVMGRALQAQAEREAAFPAESAAVQAPMLNKSPADLASALAAQQAANEAVVGGPGAVIHGVGWKDNPTPWTPAERARPAPSAVVAHADPTGQRGTIPIAAARPAPVPARPMEYVGRPGFGYQAPAGTAGTPSTLERTNYSPEAVAMLRGAAGQTRERALGDVAMIAGQTEREANLLGDIRDPRNLYGFAQRAAINELGGDPYEAMGRFSPDWAMRTYALPGVKGPSDYQAAQNEAFERSNNEAAGLGAYTDTEIRSRETDIIRSSPAYATGQAVAERQLDSLVGGPKTDQPVTLDGLRTALAQAGVDPTAALQVIKDYGRLYPGQAFYNLPEEVSTAAAQAGNLNG